MTVITVRVSQFEKEQIENAAKKDGRSINSYVVKAVKEKIERDKG